MIDDLKALNILYILHRLPLEKVRGVESRDNDLYDAENTACVEVIRNKSIREEAKKEKSWANHKYIIEVP